MHIHFHILLVALLLGATFAYGDDRNGKSEEPYPFLSSKEIISRLSQEWEPPPPGTRALGVEPPSITFTILFKYDSTELADQNSISQLKEAAISFKSPALSHYTFIVEGHTDADGEESYNEDLSRRRASAIVQILSDQYKVPTNTLRPVGKGELEPAADNRTEAGKQRNRRVVILRSS